MKKKYMTILASSVVLCLAVCFLPVPKRVMQVHKGDFYKVTNLEKPVCAYENLLLTDIETVKESRGQFCINGWVKHYLLRADIFVGWIGIANENGYEDSVKIKTHIWQSEKVLGFDKKLFPLTDVVKKSEILKHGKISNYDNVGNVLTDRSCILLTDDFGEVFIGYELWYGLDNNEIWLERQMFFTNTDINGEELVKLISDNSNYWIDKQVGKN